MSRTQLHIVWLFIFNASLIILTPLIRGPGNYLAFTLIFLSTNLLILSFVWQAIKNGSIEIVLSPLSAVSLFFLAVILSSFFFTINPASTRYGFFTMASVIINGLFLSFIRPTGLHHPHLFPLPEGEETILLNPLHDRGETILPNPLYEGGERILLNAGSGLQPEPKHLVQSKRLNQQQGGDGVNKMFSEQRIWQGLCAVLVITVTALSLMALYQYLTGHGSFEGRGHATFVNPNSFAGYLLLTMPILIGLYLNAGSGLQPEPKHLVQSKRLNQQQRMKYIFLFLSLLSFAALLSTGTGGRWIILTAAIAVALILFRIFAPSAGKRLIFLAVGFLAVLLIFLAPTGKNAASFSPNPATISGSTTDRLNIWKSTWGVIKEHPIRGVGFWSFHTIYSKYKNQAYKDVEHYFSHNDYLQLWAELGLIGVGVFLVLIYLYFRDGLRCLKKMSSPQKENPPISPFSKGGTNDPPFVKGGAGGFLYIMLLSTLIGSFLVLIHTISDFDLYIPAILFIFWGYIAYTASTASELGLCKTKVIDLSQFRIFTTLGKKKLYIITAGIFAFLSFWVSDPYLAGLYNERGKGYLAKGEYEKAVKFFSKAVEIDSIDDSYHFNLGLALAKFSNNDPLILKRAEHEMKTAMKIAPYRSDIYSNLANFYREFYLKEKGNTAIEMMKKAKEFDPLDATIIHNLAVLYLQLRMYKEAIGEFKKYLNEKPDDIEAHIEISGAYRMNKEYDNTLKEIDWLLSKNANNNYVHFLKANILQDMGQYDDAHKEYQFALREKGKEGDVWYAIGSLHLKQNKPKEAEDAFRKAVDYRSLDRKEKKD